MPGPLDGVRVIELGQALAGPLAGVILADLGADVIKVEKPDGGDDARLVGTAVRRRRFGQFPQQQPRANVRSRWTSRVPADVARLKTLVRDADILIQNLRPGHRR